MQEQLNPCPFCGSSNVEIGNLNTPFYVHCKDCGANGPPSNDRVIAGLAWNAVSIELTENTQKKHGRNWNMNEMEKAVQQLEEMTKQRDYLAKAMDIVCKKIESCDYCPLRDMDGYCDRIFGSWKSRAKMFVDEQGDVDL